METQNTQPTQQPGSIQSVDFMGIPVFERREPVYMSYVLGVPVVAWAAIVFVVRSLSK